MLLTGVQTYQQYRTDLCAPSSNSSRGRRGGRGGSHVTNSVIAAEDSMYSAPKSRENKARSSRSIVRWIEDEGRLILIRPRYSSDTRPDLPASAILGSTYRRSAR